MDIPPNAAPSSTDDSFQAADPGFDYRSFLHHLIQFSWIVVLCLLLGIGAGVFYLYHTPKIYQSRLVLEVDVQTANIAPGASMGPQSLQGLDQLRTIEQNLRNHTLMERIVRADDLASNKDFLPPSEDGRPYSTDVLATVLSNMVNPVVRRGTRLIDVFVLHTDPEIARKLADSVGKEYIGLSIEKRSESATTAYEFLRRQAEILRLKVDEDERGIQKYRETAGAGAGVGERGGTSALKLGDLTARLTQARVELARNQRDMEQIDALHNDTDRMLALPAAASRPNVVGLKNEMVLLSANIATLSQRYGDKHPRMLQARTQLAALSKSVHEELLRLPDLLRSELNNSANNVKNLEASVAAQEKELVSARGKQIPYDELERALDADKSLYESVLKRVKEFDLSKDVQADPVQVVEHASFSAKPVSPLATRTMILAVLGGLAVGVGVVGILHFLDRSIKTVDQAEHYLSLPVLAAVPDMKFPAQKSYMLMVKDPNTTAAEAFRTLRASLALLGPESERKVLLFTSAVPSEGKSFSSTNYSAALAQQGRRTLLIDADLRRPSIHKIFGMDRSLPGVTDYLVGNVNMAGAAHPCEVENLFVMPGGQKAPNPAELLSSHTFAELIAEASRTFDRVVIDSAPIIAVSDTLIITPYIQSLCLVVRSNDTSRNAVKRAIALLEQAGNRPVGLVLNRLPRKTGVGYFYYYSEHGYGGGVYGAPAETGKS